MNIMKKRYYLPISLFLCGFMIFVTHCTLVLDLLWLFLYSFFFDRSICNFVIFDVLTIRG